MKTTRVLLRVLLLKEVSEDILYREEKLLEGASENSLIRWINSRRNHCQLSLIELYLKHKDDILYVTTVLEYFIVMFTLNLTYFKAFLRPHHYFEFSLVTPATHLYNLYLLCIDCKIATKGLW